MTAAILSVGAVSVAIYAIETAKGAEFIARDAELRLVFVGGQAQYDKMKPSLAALEQLERIVVFDDDAAIAGDESLRFRDFLERGRASDQDAALDAALERAAPDDVATLIYTSGTTGTPKGAILTHANFFHQFAAIDERFVVGPSDRSLCFLPLSHAYERTWSYYVFRQGAENNYLSDPKRVVDYLAEVNPTVMDSVPLLYEKVYATARARLETASTVHKWLFGWAVRVGTRYHQRRYAQRAVGPGLALEHAVADRLVLAKIRNLMGGPKNFLSAGGAPLAKEVEEFFFAAGLLVCQGYGLTETAPMITCNAPGAFKFGTVGKPVRDNVFTKHVVALGDKRKFLTAIIVPQFGALEEYARAHQIPFSSRSELVRRPEIIDLFRAHIDARSAELAPYERIKGFTLLDHELTLGDELTPTQKFKRRAIVAKYADVIEQMYRA